MLVLVPVELEVALEDGVVVTGGDDDGVLVAEGADVDVPDGGGGPQVSVTSSISVPYGPGVVPFKQNMPKYPSAVKGCTIRFHCSCELPAFCQP